MTIPAIPAQKIHDWIFLAFDSRPKDSQVQAGHASLGRIFMWLQKPADILLVEDDALDAELALTALQERNISKHVVHIVDGYEALDFITYVAVVTPGHAPKVILLDLKLKTTSGLEVLRQLKAEERTQTIPVVVFTSSTHEIELVESYRLGVNSYVIKPADHKAYQKAVGDIGYYWLHLNHSPAH